MTFLKVRFTRGSLTTFDRGTSCSQSCCVEPRMIRTSPELRTMSVVVSERSLRRMRNLRDVPRLTEAMIGVRPNTCSSSACQSTLSAPSRYKLANTELNSSPANSMTRCRIIVRFEVHSVGCISMPDQLYEQSGSPYQAFSLGTSCTRPNIEILSCLHSSSWISCWHRKSPSV